MISRKKLFLLLVGLGLFSCYGGYLGYTRKEIEVEDVDPPLTLTSIQPIKDSTEMPEEPPLDPIETQETDDNAGQTSAVYPYALQPGSPVAISSWTHECDWMGVAGQVFHDNETISEIIVETGGILEGESILGLSITGMYSEYGDGGYEIQLADHPNESSGNLWIQIKNLDGIPLSDKHYFSSYDQCEKNLILINFVKEEDSKYIYYYPLFYK